MAEFTINPINILPGALRFSPSRDPADAVQAIRVQLIDGGEWDTTSGNIIRWGIQQSDVNGSFANPVWMTGPDGFPFGSRDKQGGMPAATKSSAPNPIVPAGVKVRLAIEVDTAIQLGLTIQTNEDIP